ncbi:MAG: hypothetical protein JWP01_214 [Myxococcales bacterium]|nr:hypothetical protein [Myxococcales bacterium]
MADDPLRDAIERELVVENSGWAFERVERVTSLLAQTFPGAQRFETLVLWSADHGAFTAPGRTIYISRRLLERLPDDAAAAFVIAHEIAHHRLGHVPSSITAWSQLPLKLALLLLSKLITGPERERDADLLGIEMCVDAGYDPERCILALEIVDQVFLDYGDVAGSLGPDDGASRWWWSRGRGYFSMRERIAMLRAHVAAMKHGARIVIDPAAARARRRKLAMIAAGSAAAGVALLLLRRR